jgi:hypothetical protein
MEINEVSTRYSAQSELKIGRPAPYGVSLIAGMAHRVTINQNSAIRVAPQSNAPIESPQATIFEQHARHPYE